MGRPKKALDFETENAKLNYELFAKWLEHAPKESSAEPLGADSQRNYFTSMYKIEE